MSTRFWLVSNREDKGAILNQAEYPKMRSEGGKWTSCFPGCETLAESKVKWSMPDEPCRCCGSPFSASYCEPIKSELLAANICHSCHFWEGYVKQKDNPNIARVGGEHYYIKPDGKPEMGSFLGHGGARFDIAFHDGREVTSRNLWAQGTIPPHFRDKLPDNAVFKNR